LLKISGDEAELHDLVPISPPQVFNPETGQLTPRDENQLTPRQRKLLNKKIGTSPLAVEDNKASGEAEEKASDDKDAININMDEKRELKSFFPGMNAQKKSNLYTLLVKENLRFGFLLITYS
jgi:hypothetical protein